MEFFIENEHLKVGSKSQGAELTSIVLKETGREYLWQAGELWNRSAPILFPVVGVTRDGSVAIEGERYPMCRHGFARDREFELVQKDVTSVTYCLSSDAQTRESYPYDFRLYVTYTVIGHSVDVNFEVENTGDSDLWYCLGSHPAFNCNGDEGSLEDYYIEFEEAEECGVYRKKGLLMDTPKEMLSGSQILKLSSQLFEEDAVIFKDLKSKCVRLKNTDDASVVKVTFREFPYLVIWSKGDRFVCIEPCQGIDDVEGFTGELKDKEGAVRVAPGDLSDHSYQIKIY